MTKGFLRLIGSDKAATIVNISTGAAVGVAPGMPGYAISKLAITHLQQFVAAEHPQRRRRRRGQPGRRHERHDVRLVQAFRRWTRHVSSAASRSGSPPTRPSS